MSLILGIDIGSSTCKASLVHVNDVDFAILDTTVVRYEITKLGSDPKNWEIPAPIILSAVQLSVANLTASARPSIQAIAICGQMHGVVLWHDKPWNYNKEMTEYSFIESHVSNLYSWQDQRCDPSFLATLPSSANPLATGYGNATIFWLHRNHRRWTEHFKHSGTIMDLIVATICELDKPCMTPQNAAGFGYFSWKKNSWAHKKLINADFPVHLLSNIVKTGSIAGKLKHRWIHLAKDIPVYAAFGDLQCSTFTCIRDSTSKAVLNISTSMQLVINPSKDPGPMNKLLSRLSLRDIVDIRAITRMPYIDNKFILVGASLNGGNVLDGFVKFIRKLTHDLTENQIDKERIWFKLTSSDYIIPSSGDNSTEPRFIATLFGERHKPKARASLKNIQPDMNLDKLFSIICQGLIDNIFKFMSVSYLQKLKIKEIKGTGNALTRNRVLRNALERQLEGTGILLNYEVDSDSQVGAALIAGMYMARPVT